MKRFYLLHITLFITVIGCAPGQKPIAEYSGPFGKQQIRMQDVREEFLYIVGRKAPQMATNTYWHKEYLFDRKIAFPLSYFEALKMDFTNTDFFRTGYEAEMMRLKYKVLYETGEKALHQMSAGQKYQFADLAHILFSLKYQDGGEKKAQDVLLQLKASQNLQRDFNAAALKYSADSETATNGGRIGLVPFEMLDPELVKAIKESKDEGLVPSVIPTKYGLHILLIHQKGLTATVSQLKNKMNEPDYLDTQSFLESDFNEKLILNQVQILVQIDTKSGFISDKTNNYRFNDLPDSLAFARVLHKTYTVSEMKRIVAYFFPEILESHSTQRLVDALDTLKTFLYCITVTEYHGLEKKAFYRKRLRAEEESLMIRLGTQYMDQKFRQKARSSMTRELMLGTFESNRDDYIKMDKSGARVRMTFTEAANQVREQLETMLVDQIYRNWKQEMKEKYKVRYHENNLKALMRDEQKVLSDRNR